LLINLSFATLARSRLEIVFVNQMVSCEHLNPHPDLNLNMNPHPDVNLSMNPCPDVSLHSDVNLFLCSTQPSSCTQWTLAPTLTIISSPAKAVVLFP
jgi:hypothetical protein